MGKHWKEWRSQRGPRLLAITSVILRHRLAGGCSVLFVQVKQNTCIEALQATQTLGCSVFSCPQSVWKGLWITCVQLARGLVVQGFQVFDHYLYS